MSKYFEELEKVFASSSNLYSKVINNQDDYPVEVIRQKRAERDRLLVGLAIAEALRQKQVVAIDQE